MEAAGGLRFRNELEGTFLRFALFEARLFAGLDFAEDCRVQGLLRRFCAGGTPQPFGDCRRQHFFAVHRLTAGFENLGGGVDEGGLLLALRLDRSGFGGRADRFGRNLRFDRRDFRFGCLADKALDFSDLELTPGGLASDFSAVQQDFGHDHVYLVAADLDDGDASNGDFTCDAHDTFSFYCWW